ncbi:hypothetical protein [Methylotuvimicrobium sp.]|uniref:hypothetical protein n=1 Tax=Methylotuvimicrobium sp. TaxID=2822413 RepID=UPI003D64C286
MNRIIDLFKLSRFYTHRRSKFGTRVPVKGPSPHLALGKGPITLASPKALPKFEVRMI